MLEMGAKAKGSNKQRGANRARTSAINGEINLRMVREQVSQ
jgi:hypothetical protein